MLPCGFSSSLLGNVMPGERCAVGGLVFVDERHIEARFAVCDDAVRVDAIARLRWWAHGSPWTLKVADGLHPVNPFPGTWYPLACSSCGRHGEVSATAMPYVRCAAWVLLPCRCGGVFLPTRRTDDPTSDSRTPDPKAP
ncbi:hypothetical protein DSM112329_04733 [Paraconexibacter sp. AEG42_29]|uniref:Uncharacterized protein n=1 Tax=Paraconexibacter sp. AEG42_29 TaxID=2997339 RepID=A0AAU7B1F7_9ACTN